jgi:demethylmacrocin O-methyltransferase
MSLEKLAEKHNTDKLWHGYCPHYEKHLAELKDEPVVLIEVGVASGASMRMWRDWFSNKDACLVGIDIDKDTPTSLGDGVRIEITDGTAYEWQGADVDVVIDDGSHTSGDIIRALLNWWPHLKSGGWYVIEDLAVQWRIDYGGGGAGSPATSTIKGMLDELWQHDEKTVTEFHAYNEIVFLRKT